MDNNELARAIEVAKDMVRSTSASESIHAKAEAHFETLLAEQVRRATGEPELLGEWKPRKPSIAKPPIRPIRFMDAKGWSWT